ncbi:MAG: non-homologous end-joining DNA ligase [Oryzomonas sp.]|jgi:bifunctional non-homologous end joining protein LigD
MNRKVVEIGGRRLSIANLEKELYPSCSFTKAHVLEYYRRIADHLIPHLRDRAVTLKRYPDGVEEEFFFEKRCPPHPEWVQTAEIDLKGKERLTACLVNDRATLIWVANLAALELHVPLAGATSPGTPDAMVFDLDPGEPADVLACAQVALILRELLSRLGLTGFVKSSGRKGLHVYVPLNSTGATFDDTKGFSRAVALILQKNYPELVTGRMAKEERRGKVFINWSQNDAKKTMICVYSLRAGEKPMVSFPLGWEELEQLARERRPEGCWVSPEEALERVEKDGDLFQEMLVMKQILPHM